MSIRVEYEIRDHVTLKTHGKSSKEFINEVERQKYEQSYSGHPIYYLVIIHEEVKK